MEDEFHRLAAKYLAGEASVQESEELRTLLAGDSIVKSEFDALEQTHRVLSDFAPLLPELEGTRAAVPAAKVSELTAALEKRFGPSRPERAELPTERSFLPKRFWILFAGGVAAALVFLSFHFQAREGKEKEIASYLVLQRGKGRIQEGRTFREIVSIAALREGAVVLLDRGSRALLIDPSATRELNGPADMRVAGRRDVWGAGKTVAISGPETTLKLALFSDFAQLDGSRLLATRRGVSAVRVYSPLGATAFLNPPVLWSVERGKTYNVRITDEFNSQTPKWEAQDLSAPIDFEQVPGWRGRALAANGLYRLTIEVAGEPSSTYSGTFRTIPEAGIIRSIADSEKLAAAVQWMATGGSERLGDVLSLLLTLPEPSAGSQFVFRLKLAAFGLAGYREEFQDTLSALSKYK